MNLARVFVLIALALAVPTFALPARAETSAPRAQKCCCCHDDAAAVDRAGKIDNDCGIPVKSQDRPCCSSCALGLALINVATQKFVFPKSGGWGFSDFSILISARGERPAIPPPRA